MDLKESGVVGGGGCMVVMWSFFGFQLKGIKLWGSKGPIGIRGTTSPLDSSQWVLSVPGMRPMLTPSSTLGTSFSGVPER